MEENKVRALISLLDDPDEEVFHQIKGELLSIGEEVIPYLEVAWELENWGPTFQDRVENIIHSIQLNDRKVELENWKNSPATDLLEGMIIVSKYQYPDLDEEKIKKQLKKIEDDIWLELNTELTALEKVNVINHVFFTTHGFGSNTKNYHAPHNSFICEVLDTKKGNPISLSVIYSILAQRHNIPLRGVNLPRHFILAYEDHYNEEENAGILFYVNPFSRGAVFSRREVDDFLKQLKVAPQDSFYRPCSNIETIIRVLNNLMYSYEKLGHEKKIEELKELQNILKIEN